MPEIHTVKKIMDLYATLAKFYDLENADRTEDLPFWMELARESGGPVLELGCGSGRVALHLAREGFEVVGVDASPEMLARARSRLSRQAGPPLKIQFLEGDFRRLNLARSFPLVILPFNTFAHLVAAPEVLATLRGIAAHLAPGGRLALELPNPAAALGSTQEGLVLERTFRDEERGVTIQQFSSLRLDRAAQLGHITWLYDEIDAEGGIRRTVVPMTLRYFFPNELQSLFEQSGLRLLQAWGDYDRSVFTEESPILLVAGGI